MVSYDFYLNEYAGKSIPQSDWTEAEKRAEDVLEHYEKIYTVEADDETKYDMAICAIAEAVNFFGNAPTVSSSIGSVSTGASAVDISPKAQNKEFYRCASLYLNIYRGV